MGKGKAPLYELNIIPTDKDFVETLFLHISSGYTRSKRSKAVTTFILQLWHLGQCLVAWKSLDHLDGHGTQDELLRHKVEMGQGDIHRHVFLYIL